MHVKFLALHIYMNQKIRSSHYTVKGKKDRVSKFPT